MSSLWARRRPSKARRRHHGDPCEASTKASMHRSTPQYDTAGIRRVKKDCCHVDASQGPLWSGPCDCHCDGGSGEKMPSKTNRNRSGITMHTLRKVTGNGYKPIVLANYD